MTYLDIYNNFMIEYDKANVSSSYPSFTEYEICTFLDKAYLAVIALKVGHSPSQSMLIEQDPKSILELKYLMASYDYANYHVHFDTVYASNVAALDSYGGRESTNILYVFSAFAEFRDDDNNLLLKLLVKFVPFEVAQKSFVTSSNYPRLKQPLITSGEPSVNGQEYFIIIVDPTIAEKMKSASEGYAYVCISCINRPLSFKKENGTLNGNYAFDGSAKLASEIVSTAVVMALENIESPRMQTKAQLKQLEA